MDTRRAAAAVRIFMEQRIEEVIMQMRLDGGTLEDCEAELHLLADFVNDQADSLRKEILYRQILKGCLSSETLSHADDWKRDGLIFSVVFEDIEYFPRYEFDALHQPLPVIRDILKAFGPVVDSWKLVAWFHFPNGWITEPGPDGPTPVAPKDALDRPDDLFNALKKRQGSYEA